MHLPTEQQPQGSANKWKNYAFAAYAAEVTENEDLRLAADRKDAEEILERIAGFDPPIMPAEVQGPHVVADGVTFAFNREYGMKTLVVIRDCVRCGKEVQSFEVGTWERLGQCLAGPQPGTFLELGERSAWNYHTCLPAADPADPADLVSIVKHLLLFAYDHNTGEPKLPIYAIRRAENALADFEKGGD